jgi:hypothetical protein
MSAVWRQAASPRALPGSGRTMAVLSLAATAAGYVLLYGLANHWTGSRTDVGRGVFAWETAIPFIGWTIVPYLSICAFFALSFFVDADRREQRRHVAPSLHIGVLVVLWVRLVPSVTGWQRLALQGWFVLIAVSVLTTDQHHVLDVPAGAALGALVVVLTARDRARGRLVRADCAVVAGRGRVRREHLA